MWVTGFSGRRKPFQGTGLTIPFLCDYAGQSPNLAAEADGNRTRRGTLVPPPILKFGDGGVVLCHLVLSRAAQSNPRTGFVVSGAVLCCLVTSRTFAKRLQRGKPRASDSCRHDRVFPAQRPFLTEACPGWQIAPLGPTTGRGSDPFIEYRSHHPGAPSEVSPALVG